MQARAQPKIKLDSIWTSSGEVQGLNNRGGLFKAAYRFYSGDSKSAAAPVSTEKGAGTTVFNICWSRLSPPLEDITRVSQIRNHEEVWTFSAPLLSRWLPPGRGEG